MLLTSSAKQLALHLASVVSRRLEWVRREEWVWRESREDRWPASWVRSEVGHSTAL